MLILRFRSSMVMFSFCVCKGSTFRRVHENIFSRRPSPSQGNEATTTPTTGKGKRPAPHFALPLAPFLPAKRRFDSSHSPKWPHSTMPSSRRPDLFLWLTSGAPSERERPLGATRGLSSVGSRTLLGAREATFLRRKRPLGVTRATSSVGLRTLLGVREGSRLSAHEPSWAHESDIFYPCGATFLRPKRPLENALCSLLLLRGDSSGLATRALFPSGDPTQPNLPRHLAHTLFI